jgi:hypothetical protein
MGQQLSMPAPPDISSSEKITATLSQQYCSSNDALFAPGVTENTACIT